MVKYTVHEQTNSTIQKILVINNMYTGIQHIYIKSFMFYHRREKGLFWQLSNLSSGSIYLFIMEFFLITAEYLSSSSFGFQAAQEKTTTNNVIPHSYNVVECCCFMW